MKSETCSGEDNLPELPPVVPSDYKRTNMDLKQQLVLWKKVSYLLDNISLSQPFLDKLVDYGLFSRDMMDQIHVSSKQVNKLITYCEYINKTTDWLHNSFEECVDCALYSFTSKSTNSAFRFIITYNVKTAKVPCQITLINSC